ncbi:hypothetical protein F4556_005684 [Kitasatospora gansuensis]|uniref:Uncharacterized protein n=1 Tax=Kitasatospora gansuensis TaxID=258050 RepID=A0A7W7SGR3_9ACTN|nr:hypothetical protein [Kitasatospora gansuensis]MBB4950149.1 hypothetical protein [Kitasatospora gansuensis]
MFESVRIAVEPLLDQGERLLEGAAVSLVPGVPQPPHELRAPRRPSEPARKLGGPIGFLARAAAVVNPLTAAAEGVEDRVTGALNGSLLHGEGLSGSWQSAAGRLVIRLYDDSGTASGLLALTDRRLLMVVDQAPIWQLFASKHVVQWSAARTELVEFRRNAKGTRQRGRVDLVFRDGSWVGITAANPANADLLVAAFSG